MITILFWPEPLKPKPVAKVYRVLQEYGLDENITYHSDPSKPYDLHVFWSYTKCKIEPDEFTLTAKNVINGGCYDVGKEKVNDIFNNIRIDPTRHSGICVEKLDQQGKHKWHRLISCPAEKKEGYVYQQFICDVENGYYIKYRVYYADGIISVVKNYKLGVFDSAREKVELVDKRTIFTEEAEKDFNDKCRQFGFDYGEVDVLMDSGKPIVIDVNNCVGGDYMLGLSNNEFHKQNDYIFINFIKNRYERINKSGTV